MKTTEVQMTTKQDDDAQTDPAVESRLGEQAVPASGVEEAASSLKLIIGGGLGSASLAVLLNEITRLRRASNQAQQGAAPACPSCRHDETVYHCEQCGESWSIPDAAPARTETPADLGRDMPAQSQADGCGPHRGSAKP